MSFINSCHNLYFIQFKNKRTKGFGSENKKTREKGAETPVFLALLDEDGPSGLFFQDKQVTPW